MAFRIGQKVSCVNDSPSRRRPGWPSGLVLGAIYTVRGFARHNTPAGIGVLLEEIYRPDADKTHYGDEPGFWMERFRPVIERKTDTGMAILRKLLTDTKIKEKV